MAPELIFPEEELAVTTPRQKAQSSNLLDLSIPPPKFVDLWRIEG